MKKNIMVFVAGVLSVTCDCFGMNELIDARSAYAAKIVAALAGSNVVIPRGFLKKEGTDLLVAIDKMLISWEKFLLDLGVRMAARGDSRIFSNAIWQFWSMFKCSEYGGGKDMINEGSVAEVALYDTVADFFKYYDANGATDGVTDHRGTGILSLYPAFADSFGNNHVAHNDNYLAVAKDDGQAATDRRKTDIIAGLGTEASLTCKGDRKVNAFLQFMLLTEIAEKGTANGGNLDGAANAVGYTSEMADKVFILLQEMKV